MAKVYARLIIKGKKTISDIDESIRDEVRAALIELGFSDLAQEQE